MLVTAVNIPLPLPIIPNKSPAIERAPRITPPVTAATGIYLLSSFGILSYLKPLIVYFYLLSSYVLASTLSGEIYNI